MLWDTLIPYADTEVISYKKLSPADILLHVTRVSEHIITGKDVVENASWTPDVHIFNCSFGPSSGRGLLCTTRGKVMIENNVFDTISGPALCIEDDCNFWFESGYTREIIFRNNKLINCSCGCTKDSAPSIQYTPKVMNKDSKEFVHGKLIMTGNQLLHPPLGKHSIRLEYLGEALIENNIFDVPYKIISNHCGRIMDIDNKIV